MTRSKTSHPFRAAGLALAAVTAGLSGIPAAAVELVPHSAGYVLSLDEARRSSGISNVRGAMAYELVEECEGWSVRQEFRMVITNAEGQEIPTETVYNSYESRDGAEFTFETVTTTGGNVTEHVKGAAELDDEGGVVTLRKPEEETMELPAGTVFPTQHTIMLIDAAEAGDRIFDRYMLDGGDAEGAYQVVAAIGGKATADDGDPERPLLRTPSWPVSMAFYAPDQVEDTPDFQVDGRLHDNGIAGNLRIDYGDFAVRGELVDLSALDRPDC